MIVDTVENAPDLITELRHQANYWQSRHADAVKREAAAKEEIRQLKEIVRQQAAELQELKKQNETFQVELALLRKQVFGQKSEQRKNLPNELDGPSRTPGPSSEARRNRGKQPGAKGYGRQHRVNLPTEEINHECKYSVNPYVYMERQRIGRKCLWRGKRKIALMGRRGWWV